jgi:threonine/homoserine/homoserine lactone efflux protein
MMLLASGVNYGFRRTLPHMFGVSIGFAAMIVVIGLGFGQVFAAFPQVYLLLKVVSIAYMLWLAWKIATSGPLAGGTGEAKGRPLSFLGACAFQWVNPKGWMMALGAISAYTLAGDYLRSLAVVAVVFLLVNVPSVSLWVMFGVGLKRWLTDPARVRIFNVTMALLLAASLAPIVMDLSQVAIKRLVEFQILNLKR